MTIQVIKSFGLDESPLSMLPLGFNKYSFVFKLNLYFRKGLFLWCLFDF